ncbi:speckle-type POZ protein-like isoform X2 [Belonocnema kinseyi]|nr:speckle-type POZ protein-like isoform X2 [Belonocnema kinseyi]
MADANNELKYTWIIDFDELTETGKLYESPIFLGKDDAFKYRLLISKHKKYIREYADEVVEFFFAMTLYCCKSKKIPQNKKITISILGSKTERLLIDTKITNEETESFVDFNDYLLSRLTDCVNKGIATIVCEVTECDALETKDKSIYAPFMGNEKFSDVKILVGGEKYSAHKLILSANSPVFCKMFSQNMKESLSDLVEIKDMDPKIFNELLRYMYTGKVENLEYHPEEILKAANRYKVEDLKFTCEKLLTTKLMVPNVVDYLKLSADYNAAFLKNYCFVFIKKHIQEFVKINGFESLVEAHPKVSVELFNKICLK